MATRLVTLGSLATTELVAAQAGKITRLFRIILSPGAIVTLKSGSTEILPMLRCSATSNGDNAFSKGSVQTAAGEALNATSGLVEDATCWIEYDTVG